MIPPFHQLKLGELADFYEVSRAGQSVMIARDLLTLEEIEEIADELRLEAQADLTKADALDETIPPPAKLKLTSEQLESRRRTLEVYRKAHPHAHAGN